MKFNKLVPEISVSDIKKSLDFYTKVLGFKIEYSRPEDKFYFLSYQGSQLMIQQTNKKWSVGKLSKPFGRGVNFQIEVKDLDKLLNPLKRKKYTLFKQLQDNWYRKGNSLLGCKEFLVQDPDGYLLRFYEDLGKKSV